MLDAVEMTKWPLTYKNDYGIMPLMRSRKALAGNEMAHKSRFEKTNPICRNSHGRDARRIAGG
jgi:hypothetical protein